MTITKRNARAILLDGDDLVLIKRTKPGRDPYWVTVGGGVEAEDASIRPWYLEPGAGELSAASEAASDAITARAIAKAAPTQTDFKKAA